MHNIIIDEEIHSICKKKTILPSEISANESIKIVVVRLKECSQFSNDLLTNSWMLSALATPQTVRHLPSLPAQNLPTVEALCGIVEEHVLLEEGTVGRA